jgi:HEAT repeats
LNGAYLSPGRKRRGYLLIATALVCIGTLLLGSLRRDPHYREVRQLISQLGSGADSREPVRALGCLGPQAYPALAKLLQVQDTKFDELYQSTSARLPKSWSWLLPQRQSRNEVNRHAQAVVYELGPNACRALLGAIHDSLARTNGVGMGGWQLLRGLSWSIPDSPKAVATLRDWLAKPDPHRMLFGVNNAEDIWPHVPEMAPFLAPWLRLPDQAADATQGLGLMGTNAIFAIADLIDTFENGVAGHPPNTNLVLAYTPALAPLTWNRGAAIEALGNLGVGSSEVLAALERGSTDPDPEIRALTARAIGKLGTKALPLLPILLARLDTTNQLVLEYQLEAIGEFGTNARPAIPVLKHWADPAVVARPPSAERKLLVDLFGNPLPLPGAAGAAAALVQIAPEEAKGFGNLIAQALTPDPNPDRQIGAYGSTDQLRKLRPLAGEIVPALEPAVHDRRGWVQQLTAFQILCLQPDHDQAKALRSTFVQGAEPVSLCFGAMYLSQLRGGTDPVLPAVSDTFRNAQDKRGAPPPGDTAKLDAIAKPLIPRIQALLTNDNPGIRQLAGKALRRIDPTALPPINEGHP